MRVSRIALTPIRLKLAVSAREANVTLSQGHIGRNLYLPDRYLAMDKRTRPLIRSTSYHMPNGTCREFPRDKRRYRASAQSGKKAR